MSNNKRIFKYVTITVIRNMRELLKYAFRKHFIRWEILIKSDIKNCIYRMRCYGEGDGRGVHVWERM